MPIETIIWLIPLPPLLAFFLIVLFASRSKVLSHTLAVTAAALSWLGCMAVFVAALRTEEFGKHAFTSNIDWIPTGETFLKVGVQVDPLSAMVLFFVGWTVLMIFIYSIGYHNFGQPKGDHDHPGLPPHGATITEHGHAHIVPSVEPMYSRFFAFICLFAFGMYTLVVSDNFLTLFVGWEIMGLCSYLLIGFWYAKPSARDAAVKAFMTTRIGDVFMLLGIAMLYSYTGSLSFRDVFRPEVLANMSNTIAFPRFSMLIPALYPFLSSFSLAGTIALLLFIGTIGKSAQWPLHVWLPDAMEGPTPVSAMIHAATMVSAGVYMVIRIFPLLASELPHQGFSSPALVSMAFIGAFTALFAATIALAQNDIKKVLAYSTISQLGYMIAALGVGAYVAAVFHLVTHAFFKALLFLGSGSVIHGVEHGVLHTGEHVDPQDMFNMGGLRKKMPITFWTFLIGGLALSGFPVFTAGFWSKDEILAEAFGGGFWWVFATLAVAALLTAFYTMRQITLTFLGEARTQAAEHASETPWTMTGPLILLSVFAIGFGWVGIPEHFPVLGGLIPNWFHEFIGGEREPVAFSWWPLLTSLLVSLGGLSLGWLVYRNTVKGVADPLEKMLGPLHRILKNKYYFDEIYTPIFIKPVIWIAEVFTNWMDRGLIDGFLHIAARLAWWIGETLRQRFDLLIIHRAGDLTADVFQWGGRQLRLTQTGRVQAYLISSVALLIVLGAAVYFFLPR